MIARLVERYAILGGHVCRTYAPPPYVRHALNNLQAALEEWYEREAASERRDYSRGIHLKAERGDRQGRPASGGRSGAMAGPEQPETYSGGVD